MRAPPAPPGPASGRASDADPVALLDALGRLPPRAAHVLGARVLEARSEAECAASYGIDEPALAVHLLRAAQLFERALEVRRPLLPSDEPVRMSEEERAMAARLSAEWDERIAARLGRGAAPAESSTDGELHRLVGVLARLHAHAAEIRRIAEERERIRAESPSGRRREWLRRLALVALVALAGWLYLRGR